MDMVTTDRFINAINTYADEEIISKVSGIMKWGVALGIGAYIGKILEQNTLKKLGYQMEDGMIDSERLYTDLKAIAQRGPVIQALPLVGDISFSEQDVDKLFSKMR